MSNSQCELPRRCPLLHYLSAERWIRQLRWPYLGHGTLHVLYACLATISYENEIPAFGCSQVVRCLGVERALFLFFHTQSLIGLPWYVYASLQCDNTYAISYAISYTLASYFLPILNAASVAGQIIPIVCKDNPLLHPCHWYLSPCLLNSMKRIRQAQWAMLIPKCFAWRSYPLWGLGSEKPQPYNFYFTI